jgi:opacity protein-like surface antigen
MHPFRSLLKRVLPVSLASATLLLTPLGAAHAVQIVPSIGVSQAPDGGSNKTMLGLALRSGLLPRTQADIQVGYRSETRSFLGQDVDLRTTPVTLSLWVSPTPMLYAGGGVGAYLQTVEYQGNVFPTSNNTQFGAHLGGGLHFPLVPMVGLDLQGRYVFLKEQTTALASGSFNPSFWTLSAGVAIGF